MFLKFIKFTLIFTLILSSCKSKKKIVTTTDKEVPKTEKKTSRKEKKEIEKKSNTNTEIISTPKNASYEEVVAIYILNYSTIAKEEMKQYGIPASITLAQGILESGAGRAELSKKSNNHFGIKCHKGWTGERVYHDDDELQECFRKYKDPKYSFRDHSIFLTGRSRYDDLFSYKKDDYKSWAKGLKKAGYATDPKYPNKLISIIERYDLDSFDREVLGNKRKTHNKKSPKTKLYIVKKGDTLFKIARRFNISVETLIKDNDLNSDVILIGQELNIRKRD